MKILNSTMLCRNTKHTHRMRWVWIPMRRSEIQWFCFPLWKIHHFHYGKLVIFTFDPDYVWVKPFTFTRNFVVVSIFTSFFSCKFSNQISPLGNGPKEMGNFDEITPSCRAFSPIYNWIRGPSYSYGKPRWVPSTHRFTYSPRKVSEQPWIFSTAAWPDATEGFSWWAEMGPWKT